MSDSLNIKTECEKCLYKFICKYYAKHEELIDKFETLELDSEPGTKVGSVFKIDIQCEMFSPLKDVETKDESSDHQPSSKTSITHDVVKLRRKCILVDDKNTLSSPILPTPKPDQTYYDVLMELVENGLYKDYFDDGDYIDLTLMNGDHFYMIIDVNTYRNYGALDDMKVDNHIDLISEDIIPDSDKGRWQMRTENNNNGTSFCGNPFLSSNNMIDKLSSYSRYLPDNLKSHAINKVYLAPERYIGKTRKLMHDICCDWYIYGETSGKLWIPHEIEVYGVQKSSTRAAWNGRAYKSFRKFPELRIKHDGHGSEIPANFWLADASYGHSSKFCYGNTSGCTDDADASNTNIGCLLCLRIAKK